jgi:hypothetical protein
VWLDDYGIALRTAARQRKRLLLLAYGPGQDGMAQALAERLAEVPEIARAFQAAVRVKLPTDTKLPSDAGDLELVRHPSFSGLNGKPGLALIDFSTSDRALYGCVVWTLPALADHQFDLAEVARALGAPAGAIRGVGQ